jgi:acetyltransferase
VVRDYSLGIAPVTQKEALALIDGSRLGQTLEGYRGGLRVDKAELSGVISRFSRIVAENPSVDQIEVNPLIVTGDGAFAVDVRAVLSRP